LRVSNVACVFVEGCMRYTFIVSLCLLLQGRDFGCWVCSNMFAYEISWFADVSSKQISKKCKCENLLFGAKRFTLDGPTMSSVLCLHHSAHCCPVLPDLFNDSPLVCFTTITPTCRYCCGGGAPLALHGASQDNYKTTTRQLQDNSQDNPQDNSKHFAKSTFRPKQSNY